MLGKLKKEKKYLVPIMEKNCFLASIMTWLKVTSQMNLNTR